MVLVTGMEVLEHDEIWEIKKFPIVVRDKSLINSQSIEFTIGDAGTHLSTWRVYLKCNLDLPNSIDIMYRQKKVSSSLHVYSSMDFDIKDKKGETSWKEGTKARPLDDTVYGWGYDDVIEINDGEDELGDTLAIHIKFKLYFPKVSN